MMTVYDRTSLRDWGINTKTALDWLKFLRFFSQQGDLSGIVANLKASLVETHWQLEPLTVLISLMTASEVQCVYFQEKRKLESSRLPKSYSQLASQAGKV